MRSLRRRTGPTATAGLAILSSLAAPAPAAVAVLAAEERPAAAQATDAAASPPRALYVAACESCHGTDGRGNPRIDAPALAGLSAAYLERQIDGFRRGYRGSHPDDVEGLEMRPMVEGHADADLAAVAAWLAALPVPRPAGDAVTTGPETARGDPERGQTLYAACAVCHGRSAEGNDALGAPRLAGQARWYTARQLRKFIDGVRGSHPDDTSGASMRASVTDLTPGAAADVAAWLETLPVN